MQVVWDPTEKEWQLRLTRGEGRTLKDVLSDAWESYGGTVAANDSRRAAFCEALIAALLEER